MDFQNLSEEEWLSHRQKETLEYLDLVAQLALKRKQLLEQQLQQQQHEQQPQQRSEEHTSELQSH